MANSTFGAESVLLDRARADGRVHSRFYWVMSLLLLLIVLAGFSRSFYLRPLFNAADRNLPSSYVHGALMTAWYLVFFVQTSLVAAGRTIQHRRFGLVATTFGVAAMFGTAFAAWRMLPAAAELGFDVRNDATLPTASALFWGNIGILLVFAALFPLAVYFRKRPELHKRLMLFVFIATVSPAIARLTNLPILDLPGTGVVRNAIGTALLIGIVVAYELIADRRVHLITVGCTLLIVFQRAIFSFWIPVTDFGLAVARTLRSAGSL